MQFLEISDLTFFVIVIKVVSYANANLSALKNSSCRKLILSNFTSSDNPFLFSMSSWNATHQVRSGGFFVSFSDFNIFIAGCLSLNAESQIEADILTLAATLNVVTYRPFQFSNIFVSNTMILEIIHLGNPVCSWRLSSYIDRLKILLSQVNRPSINSILR